MPCLDGAPHRWDDAQWTKRCTVCQWFREDIRMYIGMVHEWDDEQEGICDWCIERAKRVAAQEVRREASWARAREDNRLYFERLEQRQRRNQEWQRTWAEQQAQTALRQQRQHQRKRLREGHQTLTAIRRLLAHGARS